METKAVIISGEAPESDDESSTVKASSALGFPLLLASNSCAGTIIQGEARESDDDNNSVSSASYAVDPSTCTVRPSHNTKSSCVKYNSLLHKKLRECNKSLDRNIRELLTTTITSAMDELTDVNKQLVKSELVLQDTVSKVQACSTQFEETYNILSGILDENYLGSLKTT